MNEPIYLDYNATTPIAPEVVEAMTPFLSHHFGNPSSSHIYGLSTAKAVDQARHQVASLLNCTPDEIIFTSGGTESNNHAIRGIAQPQGGGHLITSAVEHPAVSEVISWLAKQGFQVTILPVDVNGWVNPVDLEAAIRPDTLLVSVMHANNEVGTLQPIQELAEITHQHGAYFHTDAAQTVGKIPVDVKALDIDLLSIAGHKLYAPKGIGALYIRHGIPLANLMFGAGHEMGRRPGTENVLEIAGLGAACQMAERDMEWLPSWLRLHRDRLESKLIEVIGTEKSRVNGHREKRLPNTFSLAIRDLDANLLVAGIGTQVAVSTGSACHADQVSISPVLEAMQVPLEWALGTIRFSVGRGTTEEQIDQAVDRINAAYHQLLGE